MNALIVISVILLLAVVLLSAEALTVTYSIRHIERRILVNGTRGKSTVTEYLAAALQEPGRNTMAKITGVVPTILFNGEQTRLERNGPARITEQFTMIRQAARKRCENLILECMSISPELQKTESRYFRPDFYLITNLREDHREIGGPANLSYKAAVCEAIPRGGTVITSETEDIGMIEKAAIEKDALLIKTDPQLLEKLQGELPEDLIGDNLLLALTTCISSGMDEKVAYRRILDFADRKENRRRTLDEIRKIYFLNGFDINDSDSASRFLSRYYSPGVGAPDLIIILNTRSDRPLRTKLFSTWIAQQPGLKYVLVTGDHRSAGISALRKSGLDQNIVQKVGSNETECIRALILRLSKRESLVFGVGNISGDGFKLLAELT